MENDCEALPGVAYPGVRDNRSTLNTKIGYDDDDDTVNRQSYFICQNELHAIVNVSTCGRLPEKLQSSSSWSPIVTI